MDGADTRWIADSLAIQALPFRYASGVDRRDRQVFLGAFSAEATLRVYRSGTEGDELVSSFAGHEELGQIPALITRYTRTFHFVGNHLYDIQGDEATGEVYCTARHLTPGIHGNTDYVMLIRYLDIYRRDPEGRWLIGDRGVVVDWSEMHAGILP